MLAVLARVEPALRKSITFDNDTVLRPGFETLGWAYSGGQL
jgi:hypothetical protein